MGSGVIVFGAFGAIAGLTQSIVTVSGGGALLTYHFEYFSTNQSASLYYIIISN
jgi:hypothetical protein